MSIDQEKQLMERIEFIKKLQEQRARRASANQAIQRARVAIRARQQFVPKEIVPARVNISSF